VKIDRLELRLLTLPLVQFFETSFSRVHDKHFLVVRLDGDGVSGYGECVADRDPYYSAETNDTAWHIITEFIAPRVLGADFTHPREVFPALKAIRGHNMAKAAVEMAAWDLYARQRGEPLSATLGGTRDRIASGVSIGIQDSLDDLVRKVAHEREAGYQRIKIKIKPGWDVDAVAAVRKHFGAIPLMVDANAAYSVEDGSADRLAELDAFDLMMIEQPLDYDDILEHAALQRRLKTPICLDESIKSVNAAREALASRACRIINIKPGRVGGFAESIRLHDVCACARRAGVARRDARVGHRPRRQHPSVDAAELLAARRRGRQQAVLRSRCDRSADRGGRRRDDCRAAGTGTRGHDLRRSSRTRHRPRHRFDQPRKHENTKRSYGFVIPCFRFSS
jgi:O-succinylbenzoate synthase